MTDDRSLERAARSWIEVGPTAAPPHVVDAALALIDDIPQERDWFPWRFPHMSFTARVAALVAIGALILAGAFALVGGGGSRGGPITTTAPSASPATSTTPSAAALPPLTESFTSDRHGITFKYPAGWNAVRATSPWPLGTEGAMPPDPMVDQVIDPSDPARTFVVISQPLAVTTPDAWLATYEAQAPQMPRQCWPAPADMEQITVSGAAAWVHGGIGMCGFTEAIAFSGGGCFTTCQVVPRVYELTAYFAPGGTPFDRRLFDAILATVTLDPAAADDTPVASPTPSPAG